MQPALRSLPCLAGLLLLAATAFLAGCAGSGASAGSGTPTRVLLRDYRTGVDLELVNDAFGDRLKYYSKSRANLSRKFQTDEVIDALLEYLDDEGWEKYAQPGISPHDGATVITSAFELERDGKTSHWAIGNGSDAKERKAFIDCKQQFALLYQQTAAFQAVENPDGAAAFKQPTLPGKQR